MIVPSSVRTSTHEVLPPYLAVRSPGTAMDPRVPQKRTNKDPPPFRRRGSRGWKSIASYWNTLQDAQRNLRKIARSYACDTCDLQSAYGHPARADHHRRPAEQPQEHLTAHTPRRGDRHHRGVRLREILAGLRHDLRRRPVALHRVPVHLRAD